MTWPTLPRINPCVPCLVGNPKRGCSVAQVHVDMPGAHAAKGRGRTVEVNRNPAHVNRPGTRPRCTACGDEVFLFKRYPEWDTLECRGCQARFESSIRIDGRLAHPRDLKRNPLTAREQTAVRAQATGDARLAGSAQRRGDRDGAAFYQGASIRGGQIAQRYGARKNPHSPWPAHSRPTEQQYRAWYRDAASGRLGRADMIRIAAQTDPNGEWTDADYEREFGEKQTTEALRAAFLDLLADYAPGRSNPLTAKEQAEIRDEARVNLLGARAWGRRGERAEEAYYEGAAFGRRDVARVYGPRSNPKLLVLNPSDALAAEIERRLRRRLTPREKTLLAQARKDFNTFQGREATARDLVPVDVPPGTPPIVSYIGRLDRMDYTVDIDSDRKGRWTHKAGDHGGAKRSTPPVLVAVPGRKDHNYVIAQPRGARTYFKPTHGLMG